MSTSKPKPKKPRPTAARAFLDVLWWQAVVAIPFALFFGTLSGAKPRIYLEAYLLSLYFTYTIGYTLWALDTFVRPGLERWDETAKPLQIMLRHVLIYGGASITASYVAALLIRFTIMPSFLGSLRDVLTIGMFSLLFAALFMGIFMAMNFYQKSIDRARTDEELNLARRIQRSFLLSQFPERPRLEIHAINVSSKQVSGDFYDVVTAGEDAFLLAIADVAGKGVPAALLSSMLQASLRTQANTIPSVAAILRNINTLVYRSTAVNQFATFFLARVDEPSLSLSYSNAGHNHPVVFRRDGRRLPLAVGGTVVGILEAAEFEEETIALEPGDRVVFYTDGLSEATNEANELLGDDRLIEMIARLPRDLSARDTTEKILEGVRGFLNGVEAGDDMTLMVLRVLDHDGRPATTPASA